MPRKKIAESKAIRLLRNLRGSLKNSRLMDFMSYFRSNFSAQPTNLAQDTRIANDLITDSVNQMQDSPNRANFAHSTFKSRARKILRIAIPAGLNSLLDIANIIIGIFLMGQLSQFHIIAVGLGLNFFMMLFAITNIFFVGTNAQISRLYGMGDFSGICAVLSSMFFGVCLLSLPIFLVADSLQRTYFEWIGVDGTSQILGEIFTTIIIATIPAVLLRTIIIAAFNAIGNTKTPFYIKIFTTALNIALNLVLIFVANLDIVGIALANLITAYMEFLILLCLLARKNAVLKLRYTLKWRLFKKGLIIGVPIGVERAFTIISLMLIAKFVANYGSDYLAGLQIGSRIEFIAIMPSFGFVVASMALTGQFLGAGRADMVRKYIHTTIILASAFMGVMGILMVAFGGGLSAFFSDRSEVIYSSYLYLVCVGLSQIPLVFIFVIDGAFRGAGATKISLFVNTTCIWILRILPMYVCLMLKMPILAIYLIILIETFLRGFVFFYIFRKYFGRIFR
ncbi:MATE family efflux transporter [Helicobacter sp. 23-1045]